MFRVPINAHVCVYDAQKYKRTHVFSSSCVPGTHKNWVLPRHLCNRLGESPCAPSIRHVVYSVMSTQKTLFDIFQPSTTKPSQASSTGQKRKSDEDPQEISGPKKRVFSSKWLEEFAWLVYVSTENHMKCKTCLDAYGRSPKPSQAFVHGATNFQRSALVRHQWGNDHAMAVEVIKQRKCHEKVMRHVEEKSSTALKAQVRTALLMAKENIADRKFNALIDLQVSSLLLLKLNRFVWGRTK